MSSHSNRSDASDHIDRTDRTDQPDIPTQRADSGARTTTPEAAPADGESASDVDGPTHEELRSEEGGPTADRPVRVAALRAETDLLRAERGSLESEVASLEAEVSSLESEVAALERALADAEAKTERVRSRYERIIAEKDRAYRRAVDDDPTGLLASVRARVGAVADRLRRD